LEYTRVIQKIFRFENLHDVDLIVDALYKGGTKGNASDDPLGKILLCGNSGGFRPVGTIKDWMHKYIILYSSLKDLDWPDYIDEQTGQFIYYGDNKSPGHELHDTKKNGNRILRYYFEKVHKDDRGSVVPFFVFTKGNEGRDVIFKGLAVPGYSSIPQTEDLIAIWKSKGGKRFQNYKAIFTLLDIPVIKREWISDLLRGKPLTGNCPNEWVKWVEKGIYTPLKAEKTLFYRTKIEQLPEDKGGRNIIELIYEKYQDYPYGFEKCATEIVKLMDKNVIECINTRPWLDGGRDALGKYRIGSNDNFIEVDFAIEAKCYDLENSVRIKDTMRLISRLKYRQFGILVTTSYVHYQAYKEIIEDGHPVLIISAKDIVDILKNAGYKTMSEIKAWLEKI